MCPSPGDATTESAPPPEREERAPEDLAGGGSRFNGRLRGMLVVAMVALVVGTLLLAGVERKTRSSESGSQASSAQVEPCVLMAQPRPCNLVPSSRRFWQASKSAHLRSPSWRSAEAG